MHVGSVLLFEGDGARPTRTSSRSSSAGSRSCRATARSSPFPPLVQSRPVWVDDPHFNAGYHVRHTGAARARAARPSCSGSPAACSPSAWTAPSRCGSLARRPRRRRPLRADRQDAPLPRRRHLRRRHHDGAVRPRARPAGAAAAPSRGCRGPSRPARTLLADALAERAGAPVELARAAAGALTAPAARSPRRAAPRPAWPRSRARGSAARRAPRSTCRIGPHRRFAWVDAELATFKAIKNALGGTVNDVVLAVGRGRAADATYLAHG